MNAFPYELEARSISGGMGTVYAARAADGAAVAIKVLDAPGEGALRRELATVAALRHPQVVPVLDFGVIPEGAPLPAGRPYYAMPWYPHTLAELGEDLHGRALWRLLGDVLAGLAHAHAHGVIHGDVKPSNVLVDRSTGQLRGVLADFGIAEVVGTRGVRRGTPSYLAPERALGGALLPASDLYAVGVMAWEWLAGAPPFAGSAAEVVHAHAHAPLPEGPPGPPAVRAWVRRLLAKAPAQRFFSAASALAALPTEARARPGPPAPAPTETLAELPLAWGQSAPAAAALEAEPWAPWTPPPLETLPSPPGASLRAVELLARPTVGRVAERTRLWEAVRDAGAGLRVIGLRGPAGSGRRHLARWTAVRVAETGVGVAAEPGGLGLERAVRLWTQAYLRERLPAAVVGRVLADPPDPEAIAAALRALGAQLPVVWASALARPEDRAVLEALRSAPSPGVLVLLTGEAEARVDEVLSLPPLAHEAIGALLRAMAPVDEERVAAIELASGGNPGLALAMLRGGQGAGGASEPVDLLLDAGIAASRAGDYREELRCATLAEQALREAGETTGPRMCRALDLRAHAVLQRGGPPEQALALGRRAESLAESPAERARAATRVSGALIRAGSLDEAAAVLEAALAAGLGAVPRPSIPLELAGLHSRRGALERAREVLALVGETEGAIAVQEALVRAQLEVYAGSPERALPHARLALQRARELGHAHWTSIAAISVAEVERPLGLRAQALAHYEEALAEGEAAGTRAQPTVQLNLALLHLEEGAAQPALELATRATRALEHLGLRGLVAGGLAVQLWALAALGEWAEWAAKLDACLALLEATGFRYADVATALGEAGALARAAGRPEAEAALAAATAMRADLGYAGAP